MYVYGQFMLNTKLTVLLKGIVHPKMKMLSSFTHPHVVPNLYVFLFYAEHKNNIFWKTKELLVHIDFHVGKEILY